MKITLLEKQEQSDDIASFYFKQPSGYACEAGQFIELSLPSKDIALKRWFTLSSAPTEDHLAITTRLQENSPYKQALWNLANGATVDCSQAMGDFVLPRDPTIPLLFVAAGIGITPVRSMTRWLSDTGSDRTCTLLYATRDELFLEELSRYNMNITLLADGKTSLTSKLIEDTADDLGQDSLVYLSGPENMVEQLFTKLQQKGFPTHRLITDYFPGYTHL